MRQIDPQVGFATLFSTLAMAAATADRTFAPASAGHGFYHRAVRRLRHGLDTLRLWQAAGARAPAADDVRRSSAARHRRHAPAGRGRGGQAVLARLRTRPGEETVMDDRFDREFYRSMWQRVLPVGPHGIQPYVRTSRRARGLPTGRQGLIGVLAAVARSRHRARAWGRERHGHAAAAADHRTARAGVVLGQGPRREPTRPEWRGWGYAALLKELKQSSALADISAKHRAAKWVAIPAGDAWTGVTRMARTRDVLDELAEVVCAACEPGSNGARRALPRSFVAPAETGLRAAVRHAFVRVVEALLAWHDRARERRSLMELSDRYAARHRHLARRSVGRGGEGVAAHLTGSRRSPCQTDWSRSSRRSHGGCPPAAHPAGYRSR